MSSYLIYHHGVNPLVTVSLGIFLTVVLVDVKLANTVGSAAYLVQSLSGSTVIQGFHYTCLFWVNGHDITLGNTTYYLLKN